MLAWRRALSVLGSRRDPRDALARTVEAMGRDTDDELAAPKPQPPRERLRARETRERDTGRGIGRYPDDLRLPEPYRSARPLSTKQRSSELAPS